MNGFLCPKGFICFNLNIILLVIILIILIFVVLSIRFGGLPNNNLTEKIDTLLDKQNKKIKSIEKQDNESIETQVIVSPPVAINNRVELNDPLRPPLRQNHNFVGVPINIPTRGEYVNYQQVGILKNNTGNNQLLPLYGKPNYPGSSKWQYYTETDKYNPLKISITNKNKDCMGEYGCDEIYDGDTINVPAYNDNFSVSLYKTNYPRYIPVVV